MELGGIFPARREMKTKKQLFAHRLAVAMVAASGLFIGLFILSGCQTGMHSTTPADPAKDPVVTYADLVTGYETMLHALPMPANFAEITSWASGIPPRYWSPPIQALRPVKVYVDVCNLVIVQTVTNGMEYGIYIIPAESSYLPDSEFVFPPMGKGDCLQKYHRSLAHQTE
jgi:hypothetical protein